MRYPLLSISILLLLGLGSCSKFGSAKKAQAQFSVHNNLLNQCSFQLNITYGDESKVFSNADFRKRKNPTNGLATPIFEIPTSGIMNVAFELKETDGDSSFANGSFQLILSEDWRHSLYFFADSVEADPTHGCFGCIQSFSYYIDPSRLDSASPLRNDSLYLITSGNYISNPVNY